MGLTEILVVAGEASGDGHAAGVVAELQRRIPQARFFGMGGTQLQARGVDLLYGSHEISVMGIAEVAPKLRRILRVMDGLERAAARRRPACALLVDVPDFNLRLAERLKRLGIPVVYYVSPMIWAWRQGRIRHIARVVDAMLCILPFEEPFYRERGVTAHFVGSPVLEQVPLPGPASDFRHRLGLPQDRPTLALLPGSRSSEIHRLLPSMVKAAAQLQQEQPRLHTVVPLAPGLSKALRQHLVEGFRTRGLEPTFVDGRALEVVGASDVAVVASGTAALEAGLMERPLVVVYRISPLSYLLAKPLIRVPHFSLVNLLAGRRLVPELIQGALTPENLVREVRSLWEGPRREAMIEGLKDVRRALGQPGASARAAQAVVALLGQRVLCPAPV